jgi:membrane fusion protein (multidrug efflux system)
MKTTSILPCLLLALSLFTSCQHSTTPGESHAETHDGEHHTGGHHTGVLEISSPIKKDTLYYNEYVSQIKAYQHIELKALEKDTSKKYWWMRGRWSKKANSYSRFSPPSIRQKFKRPRQKCEQAEAEW